ncbi:MAG: deaminase [Thermotoga sp.]|nr:MAG: deaminase [Thermotoga sp.]
MKKEIISTDKAPRAIGPYSQAMKVGDFIFVSGQLPIEPSTGKLIGNDIRDQTKQSLENLKAILEASDYSMDEVVKVTVFLKYMDDFEEMNEIYGQYFTHKYPARCCVEASKIPKDARIEIEAIAHSRA